MSEPASTADKKVQSDNALWVYHKDSVRIILPVFVDDMTLVSKDKAAITQTIESLETHFKLRRLGSIEFLLGVKVERDRPNHTLHLSQSQYILDMLERYGFSSCSPVSTPLNPGTTLTQDQCPQTPAEVEEMRSVPYISAVGSLLYLAIATRPDITYTVGVLARFNTNPGRAHWAAVKHLFRYLKGTLHYKLTYSPSSTSKDLFVGYSDADHGGDKDSGRSTGAYVIKMGTGAISWKSKLQDVVTLSTTEAEYISAVHAGQELLWLNNLFSELGYTFTHPHTLFIDNQSAISYSHYHQFHSLPKHIDIKYLHVLDSISSKEIQVTYVPSKDNCADIFTKGLPRPSHSHLVSLMGMSAC